MVEAATDPRAGFRPADRLRMGAVAVALVGVVVVLALVVWHVEGPTALDRAPRLLTPQLHQRWHLFRGLVWLGSPVFVAGAAAALTLVACVLRDWFAAALCAAGPAVAVFLTEVVAKPLVDRQKGPALAFPSGHTTGAAAVAALLVLLAYRWGGARAAVVVAAPAAFLPLAVSLGVVRVGWHYVTDAVGGMALGGAAVLATAVVLSAVWPRMAAAGRG